MTTADHWNELHCTTSEADQDIFDECSRSFMSKKPILAARLHSIDLPEDLGTSSCSSPAYSDTSASEKQSRTPLSIMPHTIIDQSQFVSLQKWQGIVIEIKKESFIARLKNLTENGIEEQSEILLAEVSEDDKRLLKPGSVFYWNIGYRISSLGQRTRASMLRFQRLPLWTNEEIGRAKKRALKLRKFISWE